MRRFVTFALVAGLVSLSSAELSAQCTGPGQVTITEYGNTCTFFGQDAQLSGRYDRTTCTLTLLQESSPTCCNTFLAAQVLLLGLNPIVPGAADPRLIPGCTLSVLPDVALVQVRGAGGQWSFRLPTVPVAINVSMQGLNDYFTTIGFSHDLQTTNGLTVSLRP
ncbi:MAG: hypothetical protein AAF628_12780 [Planctomycetota bacterium]